MTRVSLLVLFAVFLFSAPASAQHAPAAGQEAAHGEEHGSGGHGTDITGWKWANFAILAGALGYLAVKKGGPFFRSRSEEILKGINEAAARKRSAESALADVQQRMSNLESEIAALRERSRQEMAAEGERIRQDTTVQLAKVAAHAEQEIASTVKHAKEELKRYSAELAIELAEQRIRGRVTPDVQAGLVDIFARSLTDGRSN